MLIAEWKARAIDRRLENKRLKKKCKELTISRDGWKEKAVKRMADVNVLNKQLSAVKGLKQWNKENLCESLSVKKNLIFPKKKNEYIFQ